MIFHWIIVYWNSTCRSLKAWLLLNISVSTSETSWLQLWNLLRYAIVLFKIHFFNYLEFKKSRNSFSGICLETIFTTLCEHGNLNMSFLYPQTLCLNLNLSDLMSLIHNHFYFWLSSLCYSPSYQPWDPDIVIDLFIFSPHKQLSNPIIIFFGYP